MTTPKPGTISLPLGMLVFASVLLVSELPVELLVLLDAVPEVLSDFCVVPLWLVVVVVVSTNGVLTITGFC